MGDWEKGADEPNGRVPDNETPHRLSDARQQPEPIAEPSEPDADGGWQRELFDWAQALVTAIVFVVLMFAFVVRVIGVDGDSMLPTLIDGDKLLVTNFLYTPKPGDVIMFTKKGLHVPGQASEVEQPLVKRVIATAGQTVDINFETEEVFVDGVLRQEPFIQEPTHVQGDVVFPVVVPDGCVFVMGDNRNRSFDSRYQSVGMIDTRYILGKVLLRVYPFNALGQVA